MNFGEGLLLVKLAEDLLDGEARREHVDATVDDGGGQHRSIGPPPSFFEPREVPEVRRGELDGSTTLTGVDVPRTSVSLNIWVIAQTSH